MTQLNQIEKDLLGIKEYRPGLSHLYDGRRYFRRYPLIPITVLSLLVLFALAANVLAEHDPRSGGIRDRHIPPAWTEEGTTSHLLGTDHSGRDVFSRMLFGARISLVVAAIAIFCGGTIGPALGIFSGYYGGIVDEVITRAVDIWQALPFLMVALVCVLLFEQSLTLLLFLMVALAWVPFVRVIRSVTLVIKNEPYVDLARVAGASTVRVLLRHILPGVLNTAVVISTLSVGSLIMAEAALSFLGAGVPSPTPTWGSMVADGRSYLATAWWPTVFPGVAIFCVVMSLNFTGDWLRDRLDPRLRQLAD